MNSKLEEKLIQYEKSSPVTNKQGLLKAIEEILKAEESKKANIRDFDLIDEAVDMLLRLKGIDTCRLENDADALTAEILNKVNNRTSLSNTKKIKKVRIKWLIPVAAVIAIMISSAVVPYSMGYDVFDMTGKAFKQLKEKILYEGEDRAIIISNDYRTYKTVNEMLEKEAFQNLLWPSGTNNLEYIDNILITDNGDHIEIFCKFKIQDMDINYHAYLPPLYQMPEENLITIGKFEVTICENGSKYQANFIHKGTLYSIHAPTYEGLEYIIKNLEEK